MCFSQYVQQVYFYGPANGQHRHIILQAFKRVFGIVAYEFHHHIDPADQHAKRDRQPDPGLAQFMKLADHTKRQEENKDADEHEAEATLLPGQRKFFDSLQPALVIETIIDHRL